MVIGNYHKLYDVCKAGDIVWACAFQYTDDKNGKRFKQEPIRGMLVVGKEPDKELEYRKEMVMRDNQGIAHGRYFVPFKKDGKSLAYSRLVQVSARVYATTEEDCKQMYNRLIQNCIEWHNREIQDLEKEKL